MYSAFDTVRDTYNELITREQRTPELTISYQERVNSMKEIADAIYEFRSTLHPLSMSAASNSFKANMPTSIEDCEHQTSTYLQTTDEESATYDVLTVKQNTIQAMIYIHWQYSYLKYLETSQTSLSEISPILPSKETFVHNIILKLVNNSINWGHTIKTSKEQFIQIQHDLCNNRSIEQIMSNFHYDDLCCYGI